MLPIYGIEQQLLAALRAGNRVVLTAPTGSGKTTQVPPMMLRAGLVPEAQRIIVLQPRRLATRLVAQRVAAEWPCPLGELVGYQTRHDSRVSAATRIHFLTEGLFLRLVQSDPRLPGVGAVVLDEFHERSLAADTSLALVRRVQESARPDLRLVVMSATLDAAGVSRFLNCPSLESGGRLFPVDVHYLTQRGSAPAWDLAADALHHVLEESDEGDVLIFMPGAYEIRRTIEVCRREGRRGVTFFPLHGELPPQEQDAAVSAAEPDQRKVIVSTNVAETSITIPGVRHVIDSGLARVNRFDPRRGINVLLIEPVSRASAEQRAGRAGRTAPGTCYRLWTDAEQRARPAQTTPEIGRLDLAEVVLQLHSFGVSDARELAWLEPPPALALEQAEGVLAALGAVDEQGGMGATGSLPASALTVDAGKDTGGQDTSGARPENTLTPLGRAMAQLPMHPRLSRMLVEAARRGCLRRAALWAALLSERDIQTRKPDPKTVELPADQPRSDLLLLEQAFGAARAAGFEARRCENTGVRAGACREVDRTHRLFLDVASRLRLESEQRQRRNGADDAAELIKCLLVGFPDHVALRRSESNLACALVGNRRGTLDPASVARHVGLLLALDIREVGAPTRPRGGGPPTPASEVKTVLSLVSELEPAWLRELFPARVQERHVTLYDPGKQAVEAVEQHSFDDLVFDQTARPQADPEAAAALLAEEIVAGRLKLERWDEQVEQWIARTRCVAGWFPERGLITYDADDMRVVISEICSGAARFSQVKDRPVLPVVKEALSWEDQQFVEKMAPERLQLPRGWKMKVQYIPGQPPRGRAKIQDFYGLTKTPTIAGGRQKLTLEILGPNFRPLQFTDDLEGFWKNLYPTLRKELARKYPRHEWR